MDSRRRWGLPAGGLLGAVILGLGLFVADGPDPSAPANLISGPYARLIAESVDLGPARSDRVQLTAALNRPARPVELTDWAADHGLSVRWRDGEPWAIVEGASANGASNQEVPPFAIHLIPALIAGNIAFVAMTQLDIVLVNHYFEPDASSRYTAVSILGKAVLYLPAGLATAIYPMAVENRAKRRGSRDIVLQSVAATLVLCGGAALVYRMAGERIISLLFGENYVQAGHLLAMYGLAMVPMGVAIVAKHFLIAISRTLFAWMFVAAAAVEVAVIHGWHPSLEAVIAVIAVCNALLAVAGCFILASSLDASHNSRSA